MQECFPSCFRFLIISISVKHSLTWKHKGRQVPPGMRTLRYMWKGTFYILVWKYPAPAQGASWPHSPSSVLAIKNICAWCWCLQPWANRVEQLITSESQIPLWLFLCCNLLKNEYHKEDPHSQHHHTNFPPPVTEGCKQHRLKTIMRHTHFFNKAKKEQTEWWEPKAFNRILSWESSKTKQSWRGRQTRICMRDFQAYGWNL